MLNHYKDKVLSFSVEDGFRLTGTVEGIPYSIIHCPVKEFDKSQNTISLLMTVEAAKDLVELINKALEER